MHIHIPVSNCVYISRVCYDSYIHVCIPVLINSPIIPFTQEFETFTMLTSVFPQLSDVQHIIFLIEVSQFHFVEILHTVHNVSIFVMNEAWWGILM